MVQILSITTINQETGKPQRQVQTLAAIVKRLTQCNQELEQQLNQRDERRPNDQHNEWEMMSATTTISQRGISKKGKIRKKQRRQ